MTLLQDRARESVSEIHQDRHAHHESAIWELEDAGHDRKWHAKAWNVAAEDEGPGAIAAEPALRALQARGREV